jgi:hypothetical protein
MYTSLVLLALAGSTVPAAETSSSSGWLRDYAVAYKQAASEKKPLAVVFGKGESGWDQLSSDGTLGQQARRLLQSSYVPLYADMGTEQGKSLAAQFRVKEAPALVLTDRGVENLALRYAGTLEAGDLRRCLVKYADPNRVARATDTDPNLETRYYPADAGTDGPGSYREALALAQKGKRPLLLVFHAERCVWCKKMERDTFADAGVKAALRSHVVYFVDTDLEPAVTRKFLPPPGAIPAYCVVNPTDETVRKNGTGHKPPEEFLSWLE